MSEWHPQRRPEQSGCQRYVHRGRSLAELCNTTVSSGAAISVINGGGLYIPAEHMLRLQNGVTIASPFVDAGDGIQQPDTHIRLDGVLLAEGNAVVEPSVVIQPGFISDSSGLPVSNPVLSGALTLGGLNVGGNAKISAGSRVSCEQLNFGSRYIGRILSVLTVEGELALTGNAFIPPDEGQLVLVGSGILKLLPGSALSSGVSEQGTPAIAGSGLIYGLGHAVYTLSDPRAVILKQFAKDMARNKGMLEEFELFEAVERLAPEVLHDVKGEDKVVCANVDFYSGLVYKMMGIPQELYTPLFAVARMVGWCAHRMEELSGEGS